MSKKDNNENSGWDSSEEEKIQNGSGDVKQETPIAEPIEKTAEEKYIEINDKYLRLYADFENFRKRASKERLDQLKYAGEDILKQLIHVMDDFDRAIKASEKATDTKTIKEGVQLIHNKFKNLLTQSGVAEMNATGKISYYYFCMPEYLSVKPIALLNFFNYFSF